MVGFSRKGQNVSEDTLFYSLNEALRDAIRKPDKLAYFLRGRLGRKLHEIVSLEKNYITIVAEVVDLAEADGWDNELVMKALLEVPGNIKLRTFAQQIGLLPSTTLTTEQEAVVIQSLPFLDMHIWNQHSAEVELRVCRVKTPQKYGTGFLIGPDLIMTSYHVLEEVCEGKTKPEEVRFLFDHKKLANGRIPGGVPHELAKKDWRIDASLPSFVDALDDSTTQVPKNDELDYVIVRTAKEPGNEEISGKGRPNARRRGWIDLTMPAPAIKADAPLIIAQYPVFEPSPGRLLPQPLMMTLDTHSVIEWNRNATRLRYKTNAEHGTSGAPCFTIQWEPVALHRGGNENRNDGIPLSMIQRLLTKRGINQLLMPFPDAQ